jgi:hypothetical protein
MNLQLIARKLQLKFAASLPSIPNKPMIPGLKVDRTSDSTLDKLRSSNVFVGWKSEIKNLLQSVATILETEKKGNPLAYALNEGSTTALKDYSNVYINKIKSEKPQVSFFWHLSNDFDKIVDDLANMPDEMPKELFDYIFSKSSDEKDLAAEALTDPKLNEIARDFLKKLDPLRVRILKYQGLLEEYLGTKPGIYNLVRPAFFEGYSGFKVENGEMSAKSLNWDPNKKKKMQQLLNNLDHRIIDVSNIIVKAFNIINNFYLEATLIPGATQKLKQYMDKQTISQNGRYKLINPAPKLRTDLMNAFGRFTSVLSPIIGTEITWDQYSDLLKDPQTRDIVETIIRSQERQHSVSREYNAPVNRELSAEDIIKLRKVLDLGTSDITLSPDRFSERSSAKEVVDVATSMFMQGKESEARAYLKSNKQINEMAQLSLEAKEELLHLLRKDINALESAKQVGTLQANEINELEELKISLKVLQTLINKHKSQHGIELIPNYSKSVEKQQKQESEDLTSKELGMKSSIEELSDKYKDLIPYDLESTLKDKSREELSQILSDLSKVEDNGRKQKYLTIDQIRNVDKLKLIVRKALMDLINKEKNRTQFQR